MSREGSQVGAYKVFDTVDIGGSDTATLTGDWETWHDMADFVRATGVIKVTAMDAADQLDVAKFQQASDAAGTGAKDLTTAGSGASFDFDSDANIDTAGDEVVVEAKAEQLDVDGGFTHIRLFGSITGNTGVDSVTGTLHLHGAAEPQENLHGAASANRVYVRKG